MSKADDFMWAVAEEIGDADLTHDAGFQEFCLNAHDLLSVEQAAEKWETERTPHVRAIASAWSWGGVDMTPRKE